MASYDVALPPGTDDDGVDLTQARVRTRARVPALPDMGKIGAGLSVVRRDLASAWPWTSVPPALTAVRRGAGDVSAPADSPALRGAWVGFNWLVAVPVTAAAYLLAWLAQHPARTAAAVIVGGLLTLIWIM